MGDTLFRTQNGGVNGVDAVHSLHQQVEKPAVWVIDIHIDLLADDALFLGNTLLGKIRGGDKFQQKLQIFPEILRAGEVIGGHIVAGESVGTGAQSGKFCGDIPAGHIKKLMLQIVGNTGRCRVLYALHLKIPMDGAVVRDQVAQLFTEAGPGQDHHF